MTLTYDLPGAGFRYLDLSATSSDGNAVPFRLRIP
jgi:hypothetical protein